MITQEDKSKKYEIHVSSPEVKNAQTLLFGDPYEPDFEGKYAAIAQKKEKLRRKSLTASIAILVGIILQFAEQGNGDFMLLALVAYSIGLWALTGLYKSVVELVFPKKGEKL